MNKMFPNKAAVIIPVALLLALVSCNEPVSFYSSSQRSDSFVQQYTNSKYDFLWVMDNSASMQPRRQFVTDNMQNFMNAMSSRKAVDFQMAVTTTDLFSDGGNLVASPGGEQVVASATSANPASDFAAIVNNIQDSATSFWEQGLESAYQAILNNGSLFMRPGVPLIIIFISDYNDYSCQDHCWGGTPVATNGFVAYPESRYNTFFANATIATGSQTMIFNIVGMPGNTNCVVGDPGQRYIDVGTTIGGLSSSGSICQVDMANSYDSIAQVISDRGSVFKLSQTANPANIQVYVNQQLIPNTASNYTFDTTSNAIDFTGYVPTNGSTIAVVYSQMLN